MRDIRPIPPEPWPPLITSGQQPAWMPWRDRLLTIGMWLLLALLCRNSILLGADLLRDLFGGERLRPNPDLELLWHRLEPYVVISALLLMWILAFGIVAWRRLLRPVRARTPTLPILEEAALRRAAPAEIETWRERGVAVLHVEPGGAMRVEPAAQDIVRGRG